MKQLIFILLLVDHVDVHDGSQSRSSLLERIPEYLRQLCPNANACNVNDSTVGTFDDPNYRSCCTDCSCKSDCADNGNCCFAPSDETFDTSGQSDNLQIDKEDINVQCLYLKTGSPRQDDHLMFHSFNIISSLSLDQSKGCFNKTVAPWGSLYPVFSKKTGNIYKNSACANVYNITDGVLWDPIMKCEQSVSGEYQNLDIYYIYAALENGEMPEYCTVQFVYPGDFNDIKLQVCFKDMITKCAGEEFQVPTYLNATKEDISEACYSGLASPFYDIDYLYGNVFCYICSGSIFTNVDKCRLHHTDRGGISQNEFMALLDLDAFENKNNSFSNYKKDMVCPKNNQQNASQCRPVLCPTGQIIGAEGKCVFPMKTWYMNLYTVALELKSEKIIDLKEAFQWSNTDYYVQNIDVLYMSNPSRLRYWDVVHVLYDNTRHLNNRTTNTILVYMNRNFGTSDPVKVIKNIDLLSNSNWLLHYNNETLVLKPSLFKQLDPFRDVGEISSDRFLVNSLFSVQYSLFVDLYLFPTPFKYGFEVTKLYSCNQVELGNDEYILNPEETVLYNRYSQNYLFDAEFVITNYISYGFVRICLEDSGFVKTNSACANVHRSFAWNCLWVFQFLYSFLLS